MTHSDPLLRELHRIGTQLSRIADAMESTKPKQKRQQKPSEDVPEGFEEFWCVYPRKVSKPAAISAWKKLNLTQKQTAIRVIPNWTIAWKQTDTNFIPHASTWLNQHRFEDDIHQAVPETQARRLTDDEVLGKARAAGLDTVGKSWAELRQMVGVS